MALTNGRTFLEVYAAAIETGLSFVAVNWHLGALEMGYILEDSAAKALVVDAQFALSAQQAAIWPASRARVLQLHPLRDFVHSPSSPMDNRPTFPSSVTQAWSCSTPLGLPGAPRAFANDYPVPRPTRSHWARGLVFGALPHQRHLPPPPAETVQIVCGPLYHAAPIATAALALDGGGLLVLMDKWTPERFLELVALLPS